MFSTLQTHKDIFSWMFLIWYNKNKAISWKYTSIEGKGRQVLRCEISVSCEVESKL